MNILIVGSGGREHAIAVSVAKSRHAGKIFCAPGNGDWEGCGVCADWGDGV